MKFANDIEAEVRREHPGRPIYTPRFVVEDGIEKGTNRLACCGAGVDQQDERTGERLHLPGCLAVEADAVA